MHMQPPRSTLRMFDKTELKTQVMISATMRHPLTHTEFQLDFYVTDREDPILGIEACRRLDLLRIVEENICEVQETQSSAAPETTAPRPTPRPRRRTSSTMLSQNNLRTAQVQRQSARPVSVSEDFVRQHFADLFEGVCELEGEVHLETDKSVRPVQMPLRRLPVAICQDVETELRKLVQDDIIAPISEPTPWVSALLVAMKPQAGIRICLDPKPLNKALQRAKYYMPTIDDILPQLAGAKVFSTVDARHGFWHCKLDRESSLLTAFETPLGRFVWLRLPFGVSPAPELFQSKMHQALGYIASQTISWWSDPAPQFRKQKSTTTRICWHCCNDVARKASS